MIRKSTISSVSGQVYIIILKYMDDGMFKDAISLKIPSCKSFLKNKLLNFEMYICQYTVPIYVEINFIHIYMLLLLLLLLLLLMLLLYIYMHTLYIYIYTHSYTYIHTHIYTHVYMHMKSYISTTYI